MGVFGAVTLPLEGNSLPQWSALNKLSYCIVRVVSLQQSNNETVPVTDLHEKRIAGVIKQLNSVRTVSFEPQKVGRTDGVVGLKSGRINELIVKYMPILAFNLPFPVFLKDDFLNKKFFPLFFNRNFPGQAEKNVLGKHNTLGKV